MRPTYYLFLLGSLAAIATSEPSSAAEHIVPKLNLNDVLTDPSSICDADDPTGTRVVSKQRLASALIDAYHLSSVHSQIDEQVAQNRTNGGENRGGSNPAWRLLFTTEDVCESRSIKCSPTDVEHLMEALEFVMENLLQQIPGVANPIGYPGIRPTRSVDATVYFLGLDQDNALVCTAPKAPPLKASDSAFAFAWENFRVRGYPDQLVGPHSFPGGPSDAQGVANLYSSSDGVSLSVKYNGGQKNRTDNYIGTVGYDFNFRKGEISNTKNPVLDIVPYLGLDREGSKKPSGTPPTTVETISTNLFHVGVLGDTLFSAGTSTQLLGQWFAIRPDYLFNYVDNSRIASANIRYIPVLNFPGWAINSFTSYGDGEVLAGLTFDFRVNGGIFTEKGVPADLNVNRSFLRTGGRVGFVVELNYIEGSPIDIYVNYTDFMGPIGFHRDLGELQSSMTFNFTTAKIFGVTVNYRNGRREDTAQRDLAWTIGLTAKY